MMTIKEISNKCGVFIFSISSNKSFENGIIEGEEKPMIK